MFTRIMLIAMAVISIGSFAAAQSEREPVLPSGSGTCTEVVKEQATPLGDSDQSLTDVSPAASKGKKSFLWTDLDLDGLKDLFVLDSNGNRLYRNLDSGKFEDVTQMVFPNGAGKGLSGFFGDFNNDGNPDLFLVNESGFALYRNDGNLRLVDVTIETRLDPRLPGQGAKLEDFDSDGFTDLLFEVSGHLLIYRNKGGRYFERVVLPGSEKAASLENISMPPEGTGPAGPESIYLPYEIWDSTSRDTGIQTRETPNENVLRFDTSGMERMVIDDAGNVGIGDSTPDSRLDVNGTVTGAGLVIDGSVSGSGFDNWDKVSSDDLTTSTSFNGMVYGPYNGLMLQPNCVGQSEIQTNGVGEVELTPDSVGSSEIKSNAVGSAEIASGAVGNSEIATNAVSSSKISPDAVGSSHIAGNAVGASELASSGVSAGTYGDSTHAAVITVDVDGRVTSASETSLSFTETDPQVGVIEENFAPKWNGSQLVTGFTKEVYTGVMPSSTFTTLVEFDLSSWTCYYCKVDLMFRDINGNGDGELSVWSAIGVTRSSSEWLALMDTKCLHRHDIESVADPNLHWVSVSGKAQLNVSNNCSGLGQAKAIITVAVVP